MKSCHDLFFRAEIAHVVAGRHRRDFFRVFGFGKLPWNVLLAEKKVDTEHFVESALPYCY